MASCFKLQKLASILVCTFVVGGRLLHGADQQIVGKYQVLNPLDPLTPDEIQTAASLVKQKSELSKTVLFPYIYLVEPSKDVVLKYKPGQPIARQAFVNILDTEKNGVYEAIVDLNKKTIQSWKKIPVGQGQPPLLHTEYNDEIIGIIKADSRWQQAMRDRGMNNFDELIIDYWAPGGFLPKTVNEDHRLIRFLTYWKGPYENFFSNPVEGVVGIFDLTDKKVVDLSTYGNVPVAKIDDDYGKKTDPKNRLKPLEITQPNGVNYTVKDNEVSWCRWKFRFSLHPREGLVLHDVRYDDRPILYRASLNEIAVPYADPDPVWGWRFAIDIGEYALGNCWSPIVLGRDVPNNAQLLDAVLTDNFGKPYVAKSSIAIYEADAGMLWRHQDPITEKIVSRRSQALAVQFCTLLDNYDYALEWLFYPDGRMAPRVNLLGILLQKGTTETKISEGEHADIVAPKVIGPMHTHFLCFRLDFDVDGPLNSIAEVDMKTLPAPQNPYKNAWMAMPTLLMNEKMAQRNMNLETQRIWKVFNPNKRNALGGNTAYTIMPSNNSPYFVMPTSPELAHVQFVKNNLWVTQFDPAEQYAAGDYPNQGVAGDGLPKWMQKNRSLVNSDIVVWYTFGVTHHTWPEEWPVMPTKCIVPFELHPAGFFSENPVRNFDDGQGE